jgi:SH2 domain
MKRKIAEVSQAFEEEKLVKKEKTGVEKHIETTEKYFQNLDKFYDKIGWSKFYFGIIDREEAEEILGNRLEKKFLVRKADPFRTDCDWHFVISFFDSTEKEITHFQLFVQNGSENEIVYYYGVNNDKDFRFTNMDGFLDQIFTLYSLENVFIVKKEMEEKNKPQVQTNYIKLED